MNSSEYEKKIVEMEHWSDAVLTEMAGIISKHPPQNVYHYTDINGLLGMIEKGCVWATHVSRLNDTGEHLHGINVVRNYVGKNLTPSSKKLLEMCLSELGDADTYIACYSKERDQLSQWRAYSGHSVGYSIGLSTCNMVTLDNKLPILEEVIYRDEVAESVLTVLLKKVNELLSIGDVGEVELGYLLGMLKATLNTIACSIKHHTFKEEKEVRHICQPGLTSQDMEVHFRNGRFGLTSYVKIYFSEQRRLPLTTVTVGPCNDIESEVDSLKAFLYKHGYGDVEVIKSKIPLRK